ncbi:MAG: DUF1080 domain-containing protein [Verrucomicrobiota bacterium]
MTSKCVFFTTLLVLGTSLAGWSAETPVTAKNNPTSQKKEEPLTPGGQYRRHDMNRPKPPVRDPGAPSDNEFAKPPADAVVLFNGSDLSQWVRKPDAKDVDKSIEPKWKVENGYVGVVPKSGSLYTKDKFSDCQIHIEWATPAEINPAMKGQGRGNSGVFLPGHNEIQVLDSYQNDTYADGQAAAIYGMYPPLFNVCRKPGEWQSYDITLEQPRYDAQHKLIRPCRLTLLQNGILVQDHVDLGGGATEGTLGLQDHHNPLHFRNIWLRKLPVGETK